MAHLSQVALFGNERVHLCSDYTLNLTNSKALNFAAQTGLEAAQLSIEMDRNAINLLIHGHKENLRKQREDLNRQDKEDSLKKIKLGLTVYGTPPLFTSRLSADHFQFNKSIISPKGEEYVLKKKEGTTLAVPTKPFSLFPYLGELQEMGFDYIVVDISHNNLGDKDFVELATRMSDFGRFSKLPTFNYLGELE